MDFLNMAKNAKEASIRLAGLSGESKNYALEMIADSLDLHRKQIFEANQKDLNEAEKLVESGEISQAVFNRLKLDENKMRDMIAGVRDVIKLDNPINKCLLARELDEGLCLYKVSCPIGVLGIIFEARPDVITQICALAVKSANAVILKGGSETKNTNKAIFEVVTEALKRMDDFPQNTVNQIFSREDTVQMLKMNDYIDLIIPRGGKSLVKFVRENTKIPVLGHTDGVCHIFTDESADFEITKKIVIDAKTQYPSACNSVETLLIHQKFKYAKELLKALEEAQIELIFEPQNWSFEYSDKILACKFVSGTDEAIEHINKYGSGHTDCIISENSFNTEKFLSRIDSAGVYHNASTRFADGFRYGFGAEVGISTNKTHARGPVGLDGLTIYKYKLYGKGHIVKDYAEGLKQFHHKDL